MMQLNLLPDVKLQYIRARRRKRAVVGISGMVAGFFLVIFILLLIFVRFGQKKHINDLSKDIKSTTETLKAKQDLDKILTVQNQLNSLPSLHDNKVISSRLFDYLVQLTPAQATISDVNIDFAANTITVKGNFDEISTVNKFADTLKFTDYKTAANEETGEAAKQGKAFSEVVLTNFKLDDNSYEITAKYDPAIFQNIKAKEGEQQVILTVPNIISTRSVTEKPNPLFVPGPNNEENQ